MKRLVSSSFGFALLFLTSSCKDKKDVEYRETSTAETETTTKNVFTNPSSVNADEEAATIRNFFHRLGEATRLESGLPVADFISMDAMLEAMESAGVLDSFNNKEKKAFARGFKKAANDNFAISLAQMAYDDCRILKIETLDENERLVYVRHYDNELNITSQLRWWLTNTSEGWRTYDFEDLSVGLRTVKLMADLMQAGFAGTPEPWIDDFLPLAQQVQTVDPADPNSLLSLEEPVNKFRENKLPLDLQRFASILVVSIKIVQEDPEGSIDELKAAEKGGYSSALHNYQYGHALMQQEKYEEALEFLEKHAEFLGWDSDVLESVSDCHFMLGDLNKAREAALKGIEDNKRSISCICCLAVASSPEQLKNEDFNKILRESESPDWAFEASFDYIIEEGLAPQAEAMLSIMDTYLSDEETLDYYKGAVAELKADSTAE